MTPNERKRLREIEIQRNEVACKFIFYGSVIVFGAALLISIVSSICQGINN